MVEPSKPSKRDSRLERTDPGRSSREASEEGRAECLCLCLGFGLSLESGSKLGHEAPSLENRVGRAEPSAEAESSGASQGDRGERADRLSR